MDEQIDLEDAVRVGVDQVYDPTDRLPYLRRGFIEADQALLNDGELDTLAALLADQERIDALIEDDDCASSGLRRTIIELLVAPREKPSALDIALRRKRHHNDIQDFARHGFIALGIVQARTPHIATVINGPEVALNRAIVTHLRAEADSEEALCGFDLSNRTISEPRGSFVSAGRSRCEECLEALGTCQGELPLSLIRAAKEEENFPVIPREEEERIASALDDRLCELLGKSYADGYEAISRLSENLRDLAYDLLAESIEAYLGTLTAAERRDLLLARGQRSTELGAFSIPLQHLAEYVDAKYRQPNDDRWPLPSLVAEAIRPALGHIGDDERRPRTLLHCKAIAMLWPKAAGQFISRYSAIGIYDDEIELLSSVIPPREQTKLRRKGWLTRLFLP